MRKLATGFLISCLVAGLSVLAWGAYLPAKAALAQVLLVRAFDEAKQQHAPVKPWGWADTKVVARLSLPHAKPLIVLGGNSGQALAFAPALLDGSTPAHRVIAAHRDTHFDGLDRIARGDEFELELIAGGTARYRVTGMQVMRAGAINLPVVAGEQMVSLVTCWPLDAINPDTPDRYVVTARRI